jgi:hypothetical protein
MAPSALDAEVATDIQRLKSTVKNVDLNVFPDGLKTTGTSFLDPM